MSFNREYESACENEARRLEIAAKWAAASIHLSTDARLFNRGREDRIAGRPCRSANGRYLDGWYSV